MSSAAPVEGGRDPGRLVVLLGPQRFTPNLPDVLSEHGIEGPLAAVNAGWQEREAEDQVIVETLGREVVNLRLHHRAEEVWRAAPDLFRAHRARQDTLRRSQELYRTRLRHGVAALRSLSRERRVPASLLAVEVEDALQALWRLEAHHLEVLTSIHADFDRDVRPSEHPEVIRHREEIAEMCRGAGALLIAGGHIAVLLNRLRLFDVLDACRHLSIFAWSAGAMALTERIVVFHDYPPQGAGNAELFDQGLGVVRDVVVLPDAKHRLNTADPGRVSLLVRRFAPATCFAFNEGSELSQDADGAWQARGTTIELHDDGSVAAMTDSPEGEVE